MTAYTPPPPRGKSFPYWLVPLFMIAIFASIHGYLWMQYYLGETLCEWTGRC
jgi:hypothetical protein